MRGLVARAIIVVARAIGKIGETRHVLPSLFNSEGAAYVHIIYIGGTASGVQAHLVDAG